MAKDKKNISFLDRMKRKYRLIIINDDTFEQKTSIKLTKFNLYIGLGSILLFLIIMVTSIIAFTNLKYYLPGVGRIDFRNKIKTLHIQTDSLTSVLNERNLWITNVQKIILGEIDSMYTVPHDSINNVNIDSIDLNFISEEDVQLRKEVENEMALKDVDLLMYNTEKNNDEVFQEIKDKLKFSFPIQGVLLQEFSIEKDHLGVDIAGKKNEKIIAIYDGIIIISEWNPKTGNVIAIQHPGNTISFYKHNTSNLKKRGTFVKKGEAIAIIGNTGELSSGPHLHFELWKDGKVRNPENYLKFKKLN